MGAVIAVADTAYAIALGELLLLAAVLSWGLAGLRGTTLRAPCVWALISTAMLALDAILHMTRGPTESPVLRYAAAATTFCPMMAVLGAKRPQDGGWQWVVLTLWIVLVWPAGQQALRFADGHGVELFVAWRIFLTGLIAVGLLNYLPTRNWMAAALTAAGQLYLFAPFLQTGQLVPTDWSLTVSAGCFLLAGGIVLLRTRDSQPSRGVATPRLQAFNARWRRFRDAYGALWALRILGRVNQTAEACDWPIRLSWSGFAARDTLPTVPRSTDHLAQLEQTMETLLRRFEKA